MVQAGFWGGSPTTALAPPSTHPIPLPPPHWVPPGPYRLCSVCGSCSWWLACVPQGLSPRGPVLFIFFGGGGVLWGGIFFFLCVCAPVGGRPEPQAPPPRGAPPCPLPLWFCLLCVGMCGWCPLWAIHCLLGSIVAQGNGVVGEGGAGAGAVGGWGWVGIGVSPFPAHLRPGAGGYPPPLMSGRLACVLVVAVLVCLCFYALGLFCGSF